MTDRYDVVIVGGGIVGLATALNLMERRPDLRLAVLEKERTLAFHQTGHNSGVLHSGIYYKPGSLKAENCRLGKLAMERFCERHAIPFERCGKVIVARSQAEVPALQRIFERGQANGVVCERIGPEACREIEPHVAVVAAIHVPEAGIVDYAAVCRQMASLLEAAGHPVRLGWRVTGVHRSGNQTIIRTSQGEVVAQWLVNCAGLQSDRVTQLAGERPEAKIIPFRGEYFELRPAAQQLCRHLIYPVPDPQFPFLGVHFTRLIGGGVECGPNAVLAWGREAYGRFQMHPRDLFESLAYPGFRKMARRHWRMGLGELWRSYSRRAFVRALQRLVPAITAADLVPAPCGIRAQAVTPQGDLVDDFLIREAANAIHVNNAPSPAATASLNIGRTVTDRLLAVL